MFQKIVDFFATKTGEGSYELTTGGYVAIIAVIVLLLAVVTLIKSSSSESTKKVNPKQLVFCALAIAIAVVTSTYLPRIKMPMGGSATLFSMVFITLIGYLYGPKVGLLTGFSYGLLQLILDPYILSLPQLLIDYPLAFGALGLSGFFTNKKYGLVKGYIVGILGRYFFAVISGIVFFGIYSPWESPILYSICYNGIYIGIEGLVTVILLFIPAVKAGFVQVKKLANES